MRIRSTRPHFWRSERIASVNWDARLVVKGLESYVDDNGVGKDDIALITGDLFQRDMIREPSRTVARVSEAISSLHEAGLLWRYTVENTKLLYVSFWEECQRIDKPQTGRFPRPDGTRNYKDSIIRECSQTPRESSRTFAPGVVEEGRRGTEDKEPPYPPSDEISPDVLPLRKTGTELALARFSKIPSASVPAHHIAQAFANSLPNPIPSEVQSEMAAQIDKCLRDDIPPPAIADGIRDWAASESWSPTQIPRFVAKATARNGTAGFGKPTRKALDYEAAAEQLIAELETPA